MNVAQLFLDAAEKYPERIAIVEGDNAISYAELGVQVQQTAAYFKIKGIKKGDRVLVFVPMSIDLYRIVLALFYVGATAVFLDEWVSKQRLELCCKLANCQGFIGVYKARVFALFSRELRSIPIHLKLRKQQTAKQPIVATSENDSALITFTTGSTGTPKAADRTHGFLKAQFNALLDEIEPEFTDIDMPVLPIVLFVNLGVGCTSVIAPFKMTKPEAMNAGKILNEIVENGVNRITASPFFIKKLAETALANNESLDNVTKIFTGGAPVFPSEARLYNQAFPNTSIKIVYGSTEAEPISSILVPQLLKKENELKFGLPVGQPYKNTNVRIIGITDNKLPKLSITDFERIEVKEHDIGEIIVSGPHVLKQYFNNEEAFEENKIVVDDTVWHRTGDSGLFKNRELYLTGRCAQLIQTEKGYISPFIIENQLQMIEGILMGTLLKVEEQLILVIETENAIEQVKQQLDKFAFDVIRIVPKIPRDPRHHSKIDYEKLKRIIS